ncbi:MAG: HIT family protein [Bacteroidetes bacterium]|nr:HIT family protein [Bacteroidota bacterium]MBS1629846.1 HIT family protein [Bacteroidota bacterium]
MPSIFTRIIRGEIPCWKIAEDDLFFAFLDIAPMAKGHTLVVPKQEIDKAFDLPSDLLGKWIVFAQPIAKAIERTFPCARCGVEIIGLDVPHAHMHLIPINSADDLNFTRPKLHLNDQEMRACQEQILSQLIEP